LFTKNPRAANAVLQEARAQVTQEPFRPLAVFLDSFARYRAAVNPKLAQREASELLAALLAVRDDHVLGPVGKLLRGQAYREIGMSEQMAAIYEQALPETVGPLAAEMAYVLGEYVFTADNRGRARQLFSSVVTMQRPPWTHRAQLKLAELALLDKRPQECLQRCRQVLEEHPSADVSNTLKLMGRAFDQLGDHRQAARCFAGRMPLP
jgi:tetratricopeptide (TPR) repeat protein